MNAAKHTPAELGEASNHLYYEVWMLESTASVLATGRLEQGPFANALLESFIIHVRAVMDFLYAHKPQEDDVKAEDFFDTPDQWINTRPQLSQTLSTAKYRAGKEVAHLTYARLRVTPETKPWLFVDIANEVTVVMNSFLNAVDKNRLGSRWQSPTP